MAEKIYKVTRPVPRTFIDDTGTPIQGYRIFFTTRSGLSGFVDVPREAFGTDLVKKKLEAEAERLEGMLAY